MRNKEYGKERGERQKRNRDETKDDSRWKKRQTTRN